MSRVSLAARFRPPAERTMRVRHRMLQTLGWVRQEEALAYSTSWRNVDMSELELVQRKGAQDMQDMQEGYADMLGNRARDQRDALMGVTISMLLRLRSLDRYQMLMRLAASAYPDYSQLVVDERNDRALACLPPDRDSVLIWGYGHLPGLAAGLQRAGYRRQASAWLNAGELPPLRTSAAAVWGALRADQGSEGSAASGDSAGSSGM